MTIQNGIALWLQEVETAGGTPFRYADELARLLEQTVGNERQQAFNDLITHAAAITKMQNVMRRIGPGADGYEKVSAEFQSAAQQATTLLRELMGKMETNGEFEKKFLAFETESFRNFIGLCEDLKVIKSWEIDGNVLPTRESLAVQRDQDERSKHAELLFLYQRSRRSVLIAFVLLVLLSLLDPPVTILGWCILATVVGLLVYIYFLIDDCRKRLPGKKVHESNQ